MFSSRLLVLLFLGVSVTQAGILDSIQTSDVGDFFSKSFNSVKDLFASNMEDLDKNINRVKDLLMALKEKAKALESMATDVQKETLYKVDTFLAEVTSFQKEAIQDGKEKFEENRNKWQKMVSDMFDKQGLGDLTRLVTKSTTQFSLITAASIPFVLALIY